MFSFIVAALCLAGSVLAQLPPSYTLASTNTTLGVKYGSVDLLPGSTLGYKVPSHAPKLTSPIALNGSYIAIAVDTTANLGSPIPAELLWFQQDVIFSPAGIASSNATAQVPYLAPFNVGHAYLVLLYAQPPNFIIPANFPYTASFRAGFNVSRVAVDFRTPLLEANWFVLGSDCKATPTGIFPSGSAFPTSTAAYHGVKGPKSGLRLRA